MSLLGWGVALLFGCIIVVLFSLGVCVFVLRCLRSFYLSEVTGACFYFGGCVL